MYSLVHFPLPWKILTIPGCSPSARTRSLVVHFILSKPKPCSDTQTMINFLNFLVFFVGVRTEVIGFWSTLDVEDGWNVPLHHKSYPKPISADFLLLEYAIYLNWCDMLLLGTCYIDTAWKVSVFGVFLVLIFPYSDWIRRDTECMDQKNSEYGHFLHSLTSCHVCSMSYCVRPLIGNHGWFLLQTSSNAVFCNWYFVRF